GVPMAIEVPAPAASARYGATDVLPDPLTSASPTPTPAPISNEPANTSRRGARSASWPAGSASTNIGTNSASPIQPRSKAEACWSYTSQPMATSSACRLSHMSSSASHHSRKSRTSMAGTRRLTGPSLVALGRPLIWENVTAPPPLRTDRMTLDPWTESDVKMLSDLARTPAVMRYIGDGTTWTDARIADVGAHVVEHWRRHGFGWRVARVGAVPVGLIALNFAGEGAGIDASEYEIGWWLAPSAWGRGLAREGAA